VKLEPGSEELQLLRRLRKCKEDLDIAKKNYEEAQSKIVDLAASRELKTVSASDGYQTFVGTVVYRETVKFNAEGLKKELGARSYNKLCISKLDRAKVEQAIVAGDVEADTVAKFTVFDRSSPYVRLTEKASDD